MTTYASFAALVTRLGQERTPCPASIHHTVAGMDAVCINGRVSFDGQVHAPCDECHGTGSVLVYPALVEALSVPCYGEQDVGGCSVGRNVHFTCRVCGGTGRVPVPMPPGTRAEQQDAMLAGIIIYGIFQHMDSIGGTGSRIWDAYMDWRRSRTGTIGTEGATAALLAALEHATGAGAGA